MRLIDADAFCLTLNERGGSPEGDAKLMEVNRCLTEAPQIDAEPVIRCRNCQYCTILSDGRSFTCSDNEMDYYAPYFDAATYYCASAIRRDGT